MIRCTPADPYPQLNLADAAASAPVDAVRLEAAVARLPKPFALRVRLLMKSLCAAVAFREGATGEAIAAFLARAGLEGEAAAHARSAFFAISAFTKNPASRAADWHDGLFDECMDSATEFQEALSRAKAEPVRSALVFITTALAQSFGARNVKALIDVAADDEALQDAVESPAFCAMVAGAGTELSLTSEMLLGWQVEKAKTSKTPLSLKVTITRGNEPPKVVNVNLTADMLNSLVPSEERIESFADTLETTMPVADRLLFGKSLVAFTAVWEQLVANKALCNAACEEVRFDPMMIPMEVSLIKVASSLGNELLTRAANAGLMLPAATPAGTPEEIEAAAKEEAARLMAEMEVKEEYDLITRGMLGEIATAVKLLRTVDEKTFGELVSAALAEDDVRAFPLIFRRMELLGQTIVDTDPLYPPKK